MLCYSQPVSMYKMYMQQYAEDLPELWLGECGEQIKECIYNERGKYSTYQQYESQIRILKGQNEVHRKKL